MTEDLATILQTNRLAQVGVHTSGLMHELHNLFTGMLLLTQRLQARASEADPEWAALTAATQRARELLNERLGFLREDEAHPLDLAGPMETALRWVQMHPRFVPMGFLLQLPTPPLWVKGSHTLLVQLCSNLLQNACEALPDGGSIVFSARREGELAVLTVRDNGAGIPEAQQASLFLPLSSGKAEGRGLGLFVCATICHSLGGSISYTQAGGSAFQVRLPIAS